MKKIQMFVLAAVLCAAGSLAIAGDCCGGAGAKAGSESCCKNKKSDKKSDEKTSGTAETKKQ